MLSEFAEPQKSASDYRYEQAMARSARDLLTALKQEHPLIIAHLQRRAMTTKEHNHG